MPAGSSPLRASDLRRCRAKAVRACASRDVSRPPAYDLRRVVSATAPSKTPRSGRGRPRRQTTSAAAPDPRRVSRRLRRRGPTTSPRGVFWERGAARDDATGGRDRRGRGARACLSSISDNVAVSSRSVLSRTTCFASSPRATAPQLPTYAASTAPCDAMTAPPLVISQRKFQNSVMPTYLPIRAARSPPIPRVQSTVHRGGRFSAIPSRRVERRSFPRPSRGGVSRSPSTRARVRPLVVAPSGRGARGRPPRPRPPRRTTHLPAAASPRRVGRNPVRAAGKRRVVKRALH